MDARGTHCIAHKAARDVRCILLHRTGVVCWLKPLASRCRSHDSTAHRTEPPVSTYPFGPPPPDSAHGTDPVGSWAYITRARSCMSSVTIPAARSCSLRRHIRSSWRVGYVCISSSSPFDHRLAPSQAHERVLLTCLHTPDYTAAVPGDLQRDTSPPPAPPPGTPAPPPPAHSRPRSASALARPPPPALAMCRSLLGRRTVDEACSRVPRPTPPQTPS